MEGPLPVSCQIRTLEQAFDYADLNRKGQLTRDDLEVASTLILGYTLLPLDMEALIPENNLVRRRSDAGVTIFAIVHAVLFSISFARRRSVGIGYTVPRF
jgi:hypothetical protein